MTSCNNGFPVALPEHSVSRSMALDGKPGSHHNAESLATPQTKYSYNICNIEKKCKIPGHNSLNYTEEHSAVKAKKCSLKTYTCSAKIPQTALTASADDY